MDVDDVLKEEPAKLTSLAQAWKAMKAVADIVAQEPPFSDRQTDMRCDSERMCEH